MITDQTIIAGADIEWEESFEDFPASEYDSDLYMKLASGSSLKVTTTKDGDTFICSIPSTLITTGGDYQYQYQFTNIDTQKISAPLAYCGVIPVVANLAGSGDLRSDDQKVYDELVAARLRLASREYVSITINGKATQFKDLQKLEAMIAVYKRRLGLSVTPIIINSFR